MERMQVCSIDRRGTSISSIGGGRALPCFTHKVATDALPLHQVCRLQDEQLVGTCTAYRGLQVASRQSSTQILQWQEAESQSIRYES